MNKNLKACVQHLTHGGVPVSTGLLTRGLRVEDSRWPLKKREI